MLNLVNIRQQEREWIGVPIGVIAGVTRTSKVKGFASVETSLIWAKQLIRDYTKICKEIMQGFGREGMERTCGNQWLNYQQQKRSQQKSRPLD